MQRKKPRCASPRSQAASPNQAYRNLGHDQRLTQQIRIYLSKYLNNLKDIILKDENYAHRSVDRESHSSKALELRDKFSECERFHSIKSSGTKFKTWAAEGYDKPILYPSIVIVERSGNKDCGSSSQGGAA